MEKFLRLGILIWSGAILTLNYVAIPNSPEKNAVLAFAVFLFMMYNMRD